MDIQLYLDDHENNQRAMAEEDYENILQVLDEVEPISSANQPCQT